MTRLSEINKHCWISLGNFSHDHQHYFGHHQNTIINNINKANDQTPNTIQRLCGLDDWWIGKWAAEDGVRGLLPQWKGFDRTSPFLNHNCAAKLSGKHSEWWVRQRKAIPWIYTNNNIIRRESLLWIDCVLFLFGCLDGIQVRLTRIRISGAWDHFREAAIYLEHNGCVIRWWYEEWEISFYVSSWVGDESALFMMKKKQMVCKYMEEASPHIRGIIING